MTGVLDEYLVDMSSNCIGRRKQEIWPLYHGTEFDDGDLLGMRLGLFMTS